MFDLKKLFKRAPTAPAAAQPTEVAGDYVMTVRGVMPKSALFRRVGMHEDENEVATWQEWWTRPEMLGEEKAQLVQRDAQVQLKRWPVGAIEAGLVAGYPAGTQLKEKTA